MDKKIGRNDPCPCGSGKKYKVCCISKSQTLKKRKFTAKVITATSPKKHEPIDLMERTFGKAIEAASTEENPFTHKPQQES